MKKPYTVISILLLITFQSYSQALKKTLQTQFVSEKITIDAKFDEEIWKTAKVASDFFIIAPENGKSEAKERRTEVKIAYDNDAIYVAATMYDNEPSKISKELTSRDNFATADHFGIFFNGYNDGQQEFRFFVSSVGVQQDLTYTPTNGEDTTWNAIWDSHVEITDIGWVVEMKIPYAALRFSKEKKQTWGLNFYREIARDRQQYSWNLIDNKISNESAQAGILEGIENIKTPTRLFLIPYVSQYLNANENIKTKGEFKGGLDIKYGINDAFTLDAILIPDFGQTTYDNITLNLSPFEQQFSENRPFFTEGTDLFNKGGIFYSRRIGGKPSTKAKLETGEEFAENPAKVNLLNAIKISGRTKGGLGIGYLNAITEKTSAEIFNASTGETRKKVVEPLSNFNVFVLDQRFRKNSSVSLINTSVFRNGGFRDANVSALVWDLNTKENTYNLNGDIKYSFVNSLNDLSNKKGYNADLFFGDISGKYRYGIGAQYVSKDFDPNDIGINYQTHYQAYYGNVGFRILKPNKLFNTFSGRLNYYTEFDNKTSRIQNHNIYINIGGNTKKNNYYGISFSIRPTTISDFYEPRTVNEEKYYTRPKNLSINPQISTNYAKKFALDFFPSYYFIDEKERNNYGIYISPRYRFSDRFSLIYEFNFERQNNDYGYLDEDISNIYFTKRNVIDYNNTLTGKYSINNIMNLNMSVRHYWSYVINKDFFTLQDDGSLLPSTFFLPDYDLNYNSWNFDLSYSWWFAPGSQLSIMYRNNALINDFGPNFSHKFNDNFNNVINHQNLNHVLSFSIRYFIDYNTTKNLFSKK